MSQQNFLSLLVGMAYALLLLACGSQQAAPAQTTPASTPASVLAVTTPTPIPPALASVPPTAMRVPPTSTPIPPTITPTGGLFVGATFALGPATVDVVRLEEATTSPVLEEPPQSGMKFVVIELRINQLQSGEEFASDRMYLENASGKQYGPPKVYGEDPTLGKFEAKRGTLSRAGKLNVFFEVPNNESLDMLKLRYR